MPSPKGAGAAGVQGAVSASEITFDLPPELEAEIQRELGLDSAADEDAASDSPPETEEPVAEDAPAPDEPPAAEAASEEDPVQSILRESLGSDPEAIRAYLKNLPPEQREEALADFTGAREEAERAKAEEAEVKKRQEAQDQVMQAGSQLASEFAEIFGKYEAGDNGAVRFVPGKVDPLFDRLAENTEPGQEDMEAVRRDLAKLEKLVTGEELVQKLVMLAEARRVAGARGAGSEVVKAFAKYENFFNGDDKALSPEEIQRFETAKAADFRSGTNQRMGVMLDIIVDRARAEERAKAKDEALAQARAELKVLEKVEKLKGVVVAPEVKGSDASSAENSDTLIARWNAGKMTRAEYMEHKRAGRIDDKF